MKLKAMLAASLAIAASCAQSEVTTEVVCSYAPSQSVTVNRISGLIGGAATGTEVTLIASGMTIVAHSSGAPILTGAGGYIAGTMTGALVATTVVTVGLVVAGTAITVELACAPKNHPDLVKKAIDGAKEYQTAGKGKLEELADLVKKYQTVTEDKFYELMGETWYERLIRKAKTRLGIS